MFLFKKKNKKNQHLSVVCRPALALQIPSAPSTISLLACLDANVVCVNEQVDLMNCMGQRSTMKAAGVTAVFPVCVCFAEQLNLDYLACGEGSLGAGWQGIPLFPLLQTRRHTYRTDADAHSLRFPTGMWPQLSHTFTSPMMSSRL